MAQASLKEIARKAGVSTTTVVRALKAKKDINGETRERILRIAQDLNYRPNILAQGLVTNRSYTVGVIVPDLLNPFYPELIKGVEETIWPQGYNVILADTGYDLDKERHIIDNFVARRVDGIIIAPIESQADRSGYETLKRSRIPFVLTSKVNGLESDLVMADDAAGAYEAVKHLIAHGRKRIVYLGSQSSPRAHAERLAGYRRALEEARIAFDGTMVLMGDQLEMEAGYRIIGAHLRTSPSFDAILAFNDLMALGVQKALREHDLTVPEEVALIGFDDLKIASLLDVSLTSVNIPKYALGEEAANLLIRRIEQYNTKRDGSEENANAAVVLEKIVLRPTLIVRRSCGAHR